jgi:hypothetical protein
MTLDQQAPGPNLDITVPWQMVRAAGRGQGAPAGRAGQPGGAVQAPPAAGAPAAGAGRAGQPPVDPYATLAAGERMGTQCGQAVMQALAAPQGNKLVYTKPLEGAECYQTSFSGFSSDVKDYDIRIENKKAGAGVHITGDRPLSRFGYWSIRTVMAVEPYVDINIEPGQEFTWKITYDYFTTP